jgi:hypothetical protein
MSSSFELQLQMARNIKTNKQKLHVIQHSKNCFVATLMNHWLQVRKENLTFNVTSHACKLIINSFNDISSLTNLLTELTKN